MKNFTIYTPLKIPVVFAFFIVSFELYARQLLTEFQPADFEYIPAKTDTLYLAASKEMPDVYNIFKTKEEVIHFLNEQQEQHQNFKVGYSEKKYNYEIQINQTEAAYYSKYNLEHSEINIEDYQDSLSQKWQVPVAIVETDKIYNIRKIKISEKDWKRKEFLGKLNGFMTQAYGENPPVYFGYKAIYAEEFKTVSWVEIKNMQVDRKKQEAVITTQSGREIRFGFTDEHYTRIASIHVQFLAFWKIMLN